MDASPYLDPAVAAAYDLIAAPIQFTPPARDLVALIEAPIGGVVLDVGTGTGVVAFHLAQITGPTGLPSGNPVGRAVLSRRRSRPCATARTLDRCADHAA